MDITKLKRNSKKIKSILNIKGDILSVDEAVTVLFPARYVNKKLAVLGSTVKTLGIFAIVDEHNNYSVFSVPTFIYLTPFKSESIMIGDREYVSLEFQKGDVFTNNINLVKNKQFIYDLFDEFMLRGNIPWFMAYEDVANIFLKTSKYSGSGIGDNPLAMEVLIATTARYSKDKTKFYRNVIKDKAYLKENKPDFVALLDIYHTFTSTGSKLMGSYFKEGVTSALVNPSTKSTKVEEIITA